MFLALLARGPEIQGPGSLAPATSLLVLSVDGGIPINVVLVSVVEDWTIAAEGEGKVSTYVSIID
jgi:hypothetical protein